MKIGVRNRKVRKLFDVKMWWVNRNYNMALAKLGKKQNYEKIQNGLSVGPDKV